jgi:CRP-like cAMP-binding protein
MKNNNEFDNFQLKELVRRMKTSLVPFLYKKKVGKLETLQEEGGLCNQLYFVHSGAVKQYYIKEGKEFIQNFFFEGSVAALFNNFMAQTTAESYLQAIEGTVLYVLDYQNFDKFSKLNPQFTAQMTILMSKANTQRMNLLLMSDGTMRYKKNIARTTRNSKPCTALHDRLLLGYDSGNSKSYSKKSKCCLAQLYLQ